MSKEFFGPRPARSGSLSKSTSSAPQLDRVAVKIRPSLAPSFIGSSPPAAFTEARDPCSSCESNRSCRSSTVADCRRSRSEYWFIGLLNRRFHHFPPRPSSHPNRLSLSSSALNRDLTSLRRPAAPSLR